MQRVRSKRDFSEVDEGWLVSYADLITLLFILFALMLSVSTLNKSKFEFLFHKMNRQNATRLADLKTQLDLVPYRLKTQLTQEGLEIQFEESLLFLAGEAEIGEIGKRALGSFLDTLTHVDGSYQLAIEGHTDVRPIHNQRYSSNWSLSAARAVEVLHFFSKNGISDNRMMIRAYAATRPAQVSVPLRLPDEGGLEALNRRVTVLVYQ